jgi:hypothetical protein
MPGILAAQTLPEQAKLLDTLVTAQIIFPILLCIIGTLLMIFGYKAYRWIVLLNFVGLGYWVGDHFGQQTQIGVVGAVVGAVLMGLLSMPLLKYAVALCGGMVGFAIGMAVWAYCEQPVDKAWAGGLVGLVVLCMLSFILFKTTVILFTCIEGAAMLVMGTCALLMHYQPWMKDVQEHLQRPVLMPVLVTSTAILALLWQHQQHGLIGHEGAPAGGGGAKPAGDAKKK